jgi:hypothetical protein
VEQFELPFGLLIRVASFKIVPRGTILNWPLGARVSWRTAELFHVEQL